MSSVDVIHADEAAEYLGMSRSELQEHARTRQFRPFSLRHSVELFYLVSDFDTLRKATQTAPQKPVAATEEVPATPLPKRRPGATREKTAGKKAATDTVRPEHAPVPGPDDQPLPLVGVPTNVEPYPIDPDTEAEELAQRPKSELQAMAVALEIPDAAQLFRRSQIAERIVAEKARRWYTEKAAQGHKPAKVTALRKGKGSGGGRRGSRGVIQSVQFSDGG